jgi:putative hydrolase of the HAD superfamily
MRLEAVVFDLDDTLVVTERDRQALLDETTSAVGIDDIGREEYLDTHREVAASQTRAPIFERLLSEDADASPESVATAYREAILDALRPIPDAADLIRELRDSYRVGLLTDGPSRAQRSKLEALGWTDLFEAVAVTGDLPAWKPDERAFQAICDRLDVEPAHAVYVGDRPEIDIAGAAAAGMATVQALYDGGPDPHPEADATVDREALATDLPDLLASR